MTSFTSGFLLSVYHRFSDKLSAIERGKIRPSLKALSILAKRLDVPLTFLLEGSPSGAAEARSVGYSPADTGPDQRIDVDLLQGNVLVQQGAFRQAEQLIDPIQTVEAERMLRYMERSTIYYLKQKGWTNVQIAEFTGHHRDTIAWVLREEVEKHPKTRNRSSAVAVFDAQIAEWLDKKLPVTRMLELARADEEHPYSGGETAFYDYIRKV